jgi:hypothetical protein
VTDLAHLALALILTLMLGGQAWALAGVLCSRRVLAAQRQTRIAELVWVILPVAVVFLLAARSWLVAFDLGPPAVASVAPVEVSAQPSSPPILHR